MSWGRARARAASARTECASGGLKTCVRLEAPSAPSPLPPLALPGTLAGADSRASTLANTSFMDQ